MKIFILLFISFSLFSASLINYNIYKRDKHIDVVFSLDSPFSGKIKALKQKDGLSILLLEDIGIENSSHEPIDTQLVDYIKLERYKSNDLLLKVFSQNAIVLEAAKVIGDFGIRVRIKPKKTVVEDVMDPLGETSNIPTYKKNLGNSYLKVTIFLIIAFFVLLFLKLKLRKKSTSKNQNLSNIFFDGKAKDIKILSTKFLDNQNKLILVSLHAKKYLLLVGNSNVLVDAIEDESDEIDFDQILKENEQSVSSFLEDNTTKLSSYTNKLQ